MMDKLNFSILFLTFTFLFTSCKKEDNSRLFTKVSSNDSGITFKNIVIENDNFNVLTYGAIYNGGGVAVGDINNDGLQDLYFTGSMVGSHLYLNQGDFEFKEIAKDAGVFAEGLWNTGTTMADVNNDGLLDIYVSRSAAHIPEKRKNLLFINNGDLTFTEKAKEYGLDDSGFSTQCVFFDYDKDGDLDAYVLNYSAKEYASFRLARKASKLQKDTSLEDRLYRNDNGKFTIVNKEAGLKSNILSFGLGIAVSDINNDNWPDIYISNDFNEEDYLYINNQDGTFTESLREYFGHTSNFSMGVDIADINNDGFQDIITLDMLPEDNYRQKMVSGPDNYDKYVVLKENGFHDQTMRNMMHVNNGGKSFSEIGQFAGVYATDWSWASLFADFDNDGSKDIFITNGVKRDYTNMDFMNFAVQQKMTQNKTGQNMAIKDLLENMPSTIVENYSYKNNGDLTFSKMNKAWGLDQKSRSNGAAYADLDNDGDLDLIVNNTDEPAFIYRNNSEHITNNNYLKVNLKGNAKNLFGIGSKVTLYTNDKVNVQEQMPTRGFQSSVDFNLTFGIGKDSIIDSLKIIWPNNKFQILKNVKANQNVTLTQSEALADYIVKSASPALFMDVSNDSLINFKHQENRFIDFGTQQLVPHMLSTQGPKMAKGDLNKDGLEDVFIGGAKGQIGRIYLQTKNNTFTEKEQNSFNEDINSEDIGAQFFDADGDNDLDLYVVSGGNDYTVNDALLQDRLYLNNGNGVFTKAKNALPNLTTSGSVVATSDIDNDGDLDLFLGGRLMPGQYPTAPKSYILQNNGKGIFTDITDKVGTQLQEVGMVTDAIFTNIDTDEQLELILVGEFMPIRVFKNTNGSFKPMDSSSLQNSQGWWNTIKAGDFDNDGDMDLIAGNFGLNSQLKATENEPVTLYSKDFDANGSIDPILCSFNLGTEYPVWSKDDLVGQLAHLKSKYVNYSDYAKATMTDIFSPEELTAVTKLEAKNFASSYIENLGNGTFKTHALPIEAQFAPIYAIEIVDYNSDGNLDVLLAGNFFGTRVKFGRYDANKGLLLKGDGTGNFNSISGAKSGFNIDGEVRDITTITTANNTKLTLFARNNQTVKIFEHQ